MELESQESDRIATGQAMMNAKEYTRAVHWLKGCQSAKAVYIRVYCDFLVRTFVYFGTWTAPNGLVGKREEGVEGLVPYEQ